MTSTCDRIQELLVAEAAGPGSWSEAVAAHLRVCEACSNRAQRLRLQVRALTELSSLRAPEALDDSVRRGFGEAHRVRRGAASLGALRRREAPETLEGKVVAAIHGGHRQDRVVAELSVLDVRRAPKELDGRLDSVFAELREDGYLPRPTAPQELAERLDHDLHDLPATMTRRFLGRLPRLTAPLLLSRRVDEDLRRENTGRVLPFHRWSIVVAGAAAVVIGLSWWNGSEEGDGSRSTPERPFEVVHVDDLTGLSPVVRSFVDTVTGGTFGVFQALPPQTTETETAAATQPTGGHSSRGQSTTSSAGSSSPAAAPPTAGNTRGSTSAPASTNTSSPTGSRVPTGSSLGSTTGPSFFDKVADAPFVTAYRGTRHVLERRSSDLGPVVDFESVELVASDGAGNFTVEVEDVLVPPLPQAEIDRYELIQSYRVGFLYRYRDFGIDDQQRFWQNYLVIDTGVLQDVAGQMCAVLEVERHDGRGDVFTVWVEPGSGLVLQEEERTRLGMLVRKVWFESFQLNADLSDLELTSGTSQWQEFSLDRPGLLGFELLVPRAVPTGYRFEQVGSCTGADPTGATWVRFVYGDGAENVFFMHSDQYLKPGDPLFTGVSDDCIRVVRYGAWTVAEGKIRGRHSFAIGKVDVDELLMLLQSAVE